MAIYVDALMNWGWKMRGHTVASCHMFTDSLDLAELHDFAAKIGMKRSWFQESRVCPHYDLVHSRREHAIALGAIAVDRRQASEIWQARKELVKAAEAQSHETPNEPGQ